MWRYAGLLVPLLLIGCASTGPNNGQVYIASAENGQEFGGASCTVLNNTQSWNIVTPTTLSIGGANGELRVVCNRAGYRTSEVRLPPISSGSGSNVGVGLGGGTGAVGLGLGFRLPISSGGGYYPARVIVNMNRQ